MNYYGFDFSSSSRVVLVGKEHLLPPRKHTARCTREHILYFVLNGELKLLSNEEELTLLPGDIYIFEKGTVQKPLSIAECEYYYVHFTDESFALYDCSASDYETDLKDRNLNYTKSSIYGLDRTDCLKAFLPQKIHIEDNNSHLILEEKLNKLNKVFYRKEFETRIDLPYLFAQVILFCENAVENQLFKKKASTPGFAVVKEVADFINENYYLDIGKAMIEEKFMFNYDYINRIFKKMMGESVVKYRNRVRIDNAKHLLKTTELDTEEISERVGFGDKYYFIRYFTRKVGISPAHFKSKEKYNAL